MILCLRVSHRPWFCYLPNFSLYKASVRAEPTRSEFPNRNPIETGRVPQVRTRVSGLKKTGRSPISADFFRMFFAKTRTESSSCLHRRNSPSEALFGRRNPPRKKVLYRCGLLSRFVSIGKRILYLLDFLFGQHLIERDSPVIEQVRPVAEYRRATNPGEPDHHQR